MHTISRVLATATFAATLSSSAALGAQSCSGQVVKLSASDSASGHHFGSSVALQAGTLVVGADQYHFPFLESGAAYVLRLLVRARAPVKLDGNGRLAFGPT